MIRGPAPTGIDAERDEDAVLEDFLALGRAYAGARRENEIIEAFLGRVQAYTPSCTLSVRVRDLVDGTIRLYGAAVGRDVSLRRVFAGSLSGVVDLGCFEPTPTFESDFPDAPLGRDLTAVFDGKLVAVVSVNHGEGGAPSERAFARVARFAEQLGEAIAGLLEKSETARLRLYAGSIVDRTNVPIAVVDGAGHVRLSNAALRQVLGLDSVELAAGTLLGIVDADHRRAVAVAHARAMRRRASTGVELVAKTTKAGEHRLLVDFEPIPLPNGEIDSVLVVARDVTRVRQLEDQISHADRLATLGQLAAGVVHELNNPLTTILVYTEYVLRRAELRSADDGEVDKLKRVLDAAGRIQEFAKDLVTYARTERGHREPLAVTQVIDQAIAFCSPILERGRVVVSREYANDVPSLPAVRGQLQQIFVNLITNAVQAVEPEAGRVHLSVSSATPGWVDVRIDDNGPGVPDDRRAEIFQPFVTTKASGQGTGLGLSIVRNLVERHGGTIDVEPSAFGGASFLLRLPTKPISERPPVGGLKVE